MNFTADAYIYHWVEADYDLEAHIATRSALTCDIATRADYVTYIEPQRLYDLDKKRLLQKD